MGGVKIQMENKDVGADIIAIIIVVVAAAAVGGYMVMSGDNGGGEGADLRFPESGSQVTDEPVFTWNPVSSSDSQRVLIDDEPSFSQPLVENVTVSDQETTYRASLSKGTYYWTVRGVKGSEISKTENRSFTVVDWTWENTMKPAFDYFWNEADPVTYQVPDKLSQPEMGSVAVTGYGLTAYAIGENNGWITESQAEERILNTLEFARDSIEKKDGVMYHFVWMGNGNRYGGSEVSLIDTALFLSGALTASEYFENQQITDVTEQIYDNVDWTWMLNQDDTLAGAWKPDEGFGIKRTGYDEYIIAYLLAMGSDTHPIPPESWNAFKTTYENAEYQGLSFLSPGGMNRFHSYLWTMPAGYFDWMETKGPDGENYWTATKKALKANELWGRTGNYGHWENGWGWNACEDHTKAGDYLGYDNLYGGTISPSTQLGGLSFSENSSRALRDLFSLYGSEIWGKYGFTDAFNVGENWFWDNFAGLNLGISLVGAQNQSNDMVWDTFMKNSEVKEGLRKAGFTNQPTRTEPVQIRPYNDWDYADNNITFEWSSVPGATYNLQVDDNSDFSSPVIDTTLSDNTYTEELSRKTYHWRVSADRNWSPENWSFEVAGVITENFYPVADTTTEKGVDEVRGLWDLMMSRGSMDGGQRRSYLKFDLDRIPSDFQVINSELSVYQTTIYAPTWDKTVYLSRVSDDTWSEENTVWDNQPTFGSTIDKDEAESSSPAWLNYSVKDWTEEQADELMSVALTMQEDEKTAEPWFRTMEFGGYHPELTVTYSFVGKPKLAYPGDGTDISENFPTFKWEHADEANSYTIKVDNNSDFSSPEVNATTSDNKYTSTTKLDYGTWYWKVTAEKQDITYDSDTWSYTKIHLG